MRRARRAACVQDMSSFVSEPLTDTRSERERDVSETYVRASPTEVGWGLRGGRASAGLSGLVTAGGKREGEVCRSGKWLDPQRCYYKAKQSRE